MGLISQAGTDVGAFNEETITKLAKRYGADFEKDIEKSKIRSKIIDGLRALKSSNDPVRKRSKKYPGIAESRETPLLRWHRFDGSKK